MLALAAGCPNAAKLSIGPETNDPQYQYGEQMLKENNTDDALTAFAKVIHAREDDAPESHLETGLLLLNVRNDPIGAIYHFQKYLAALPNSDQAPRVAELIETAKKNFARSLPMHPTGAYDEADLIDQIKSLQTENQQLRDQLGGGSSLRLTAVPLGNATRPPPVSTPPTVITPPPQPTRPVVTNVRPTIAVTPTPVTPTASSANTYTVKDHDTLMSISLAVYGTRSRWQDIYNANRDKLSTPEALHANQVLTLPAK
ncbi:MAG TPA: LysM peptidoglycan-binding domain-containing protein [Opitutales bacterium]|nr:LysM peptidoglycan-binding domain-containing protein [Opitutales bacterium]